MPPHIASLNNFRKRFVVHARALPHDDEYVFNGRTFGERFVDIALERDHLTAAIPTVGSDEHFASAIVDAVAQRFRGEATKHHRMHGANARAREHREHRFRNHRQVNRHAIAFFHAEVFQHVRGEICFAVYVPIRERAFVARFAFPNERGFIAARAVEVAIDTIDAGIQFATAKPLYVRRGPFHHRVPRFVPRQLGGLFSPEGLGVRQGAGIQRIVTNARLAGKIWRRRKRARFGEQDVDVIHGEARDWRWCQRRNRGMCVADRLSAKLMLKRVAGNRSGGYALPCTPNSL